MTKFGQFMENIELAFYKTFNTSLFHPAQHLMLIDKTKAKLSTAKEQPPKDSDYYIAKIKGKKITFVKKDDDDNGDSGDNSGSGIFGHDIDNHLPYDDEQDYVADEGKAFEDEFGDDHVSHLDRIVDQLNERKIKDHYKDDEVFNEHLEQIENIKKNLNRTKKIPINETDPLYLMLAEAICGSLAEMNITVLDNDQDAYISGILEFLDNVTSTSNQKELLNMQKEKFPTLCSIAEQTIPEGFNQEVTHKPPKPGM